MGMFDRLYDGEGREWQTKALGRALSSFEVGDRVHRADDSYQFEILGPITGNIGESEFALATMRDGVLAEIDAERDAELPLLTYGGDGARTPPTRSPRRRARNDPGENPMSTIDEQTAWPDDESTATADAMIRYFARRAAIFDGIAQASMHVYFRLDKDADGYARRAAIFDGIAQASMHVYFRLDKDADGYDEAGRDWVAKIGAFVTTASVAALLVQVQKRDRGMADEIAAELYDLIDAGDVWGELGWDWLTERGVDAQAVYDDAEARAKAVQPDGAS